MQFNIWASAFIYYQILFGYWGCRPCGGAVVAYPEGHETLQSCCQWTVETQRSWSWWWRSSNQGPQRCHQEGTNLRTEEGIRLNWSHSRRVVFLRAQYVHACISTFKVLSGGISRGAGSQTGSLWTGLRTQRNNVPHRQTSTGLRFPHLHVIDFLPSTCCDGLDREEPLRLRVSPWHTVSKGLGRMERKSLKDRRWAASVSSAEGRTGATGRGKSWDSKGSSVLLYRPKALATPRRAGTMYLQRYSVEENERFKEGCWQMVTSHGNTKTLLQYLYHEPLGFCRYFAGPAWCPCLPPRSKSNHHILKLHWEGFHIWHLNPTIAPLHNLHCLTLLQVSAASPPFVLPFIFTLSICSKAGVRRNADWLLTLKFHFNKA